MPTAFARHGKRAIASRTFWRPRSTPCCTGSGWRMARSAAPDADAAEKIARRRDAARGRGELSDRTGQGAGVVTGRLSPGEVRAGGCDAADAALDAARFQRRLPASVARERGEASWVDAVIPGCAKRRPGTAG